MPKKRARGKSSSVDARPKKRARITSAPAIEQNLLITNIKEEYVDADMLIKSEPVDNGYEYEAMLDGTQENQAQFEAEFGLVSQLEFIKSEIDVDDETMAALREEMLQVSQNASESQSPIDELNKVDKKKKVKAKKKAIEYFGKSSIERNTFDPSEPDPLDIEVNGVKMVKCRFCDIQSTTRNRSYIKLHMRVHTGVKPHACMYCKQRFTHSSALGSHIRYHHKTKSIWKCSLCRVLFFTEKDFDEHELKCVKRRTFECHICKLKIDRLFFHKVKEHMRKAHTGEKIVKCEHCDETFLTKHSLSSHMQHHKEVMIFKCSCCKVRFKTEEPWKKHEIICKNRRRLECHICKYSYARLTLEGLKMHMRKHTGEKPYQCQHCHKYFPRPEALNFHMQRHRELLSFKCKMCHRLFWNSDDQKQHEDKCKKRRYECHLCRFTKFGLSFNKFRRHMVRHIGERYIKCMACSDTFSTSAALARHVTEKHPKLVSLLCPNCNRRFSSRSVRDAHQALCTTRRVECYICNMQTKTLKRLRAHMVAKHTAVARFKCAKCPKKFLLAANLRIHLKSHNEDVWLKCDYCPKKFIHIKYKKKHEFRCRKVFECCLCKEVFPSFAILHGVHMRTHLGEKPYNCTHCPKSFASIRCYNLHVIAIHLHQYKFQCTVCNGVVSKNKDVLHHQRNCIKPIRQSVGIVYFKCSLCNVDIPRVPELRKHILSSECTKHPKKRR